MKRTLAALLIGLGGTLLLPRPVHAQDVTLPVALSGESTRTLHQLAEADKLAAAGQWSDAIEEYQHVLEEAADDLAPVDPQRRLCVQARWVCHARLAALPAEGLRLYRERVDGEAGRWLEQAEADRDPRLLRRVVDDAFCSRSGDRALDRLGELAFERGDFVMAEHWWRLLTPLASEVASLPSGKGAEDSKSKIENRKSKILPLFPDPQVDVARVRAKQVLARLFRGERHGLKEELAAFRALHGKAEGRFAGRQGPYADTLEALAGPDSPLAPPLDEDTWTTFAGAPSRNHVAPTAPTPLRWHVPLGDSPWPVRLSDRPREEDLPGDGGVASLPFHPIILGDQVLVADARRVIGYDLLTGEQTGRYDLVSDGKVQEPALSLKLPAQPGLSYTLTAAGGHVYARLGAQALGPRREDQKPAETDSYLVCLDPRPEGGTFRQRWLVRAGITDFRGESAFFEGTPVVHDGRVYVAVTRFAGAVSTTAVACYDAETGAPRWPRRVDVCEVRDRPPGERRVRHHLLTLAGPNLVYCSHAGAVVALEADTGRRAWATRYPSRGDRTAEGEPSPRGLAPALFAAGRLFLAPADLGQLLCLDPETGRTLWQAEPPVEVVHLLGVARDKVIFTTPTGIRALDVDTGLALRGWIQPDEGSGRLPPFGRGLLAGGLVFWPTQDGLRVLSQEDGAPAEDWYPFLASRERMGNLALAGGCLVVAGERELWAYVPESRRLSRRRREAAAAPQSAEARYRLALAEADAGLHAQAREDFAAAERLARAGEQGQAPPLRELARAGRYRLLLDGAERARARGRREQAAADLARAADPEFSLEQRLRVLAQQAAVWVEAGRHDRAVAAWQAILEDRHLRDGTLPDADGLLRPAGVVAEARIGELIRAHGSGVYEVFEQRARELLDSAPADRRTEALEGVLRAFPNAVAANPALLQQAEREEQGGQPQAAAHLYRLALERGGDGPGGGLPLAALARASEQCSCWEAALVVWQRLAREHGQEVLPGLDPGRPVRDAVAARLDRPEYRTLLAPPSNQPLAPAWEAALAPGEELLPAEEGSGEVGGHASWFSVRGSELVCRESATGKPRWSRVLGRAPSWIGRCGGLLLAAGADDVQCLSLADGDLAWSVSRATAEADRWGHFQVSDRRLFFLEGERRLLALEAESGRLLWDRWAPGGRVRALEPGGRFGPFYHAGPEWVTVQATAGKVLVLDSRTGTLARQADTPREPWPRPPLPVGDGRLCLAPDARHVILFDPAGGREVWARQTPSPTVSASAPQVLGGPGALLLLVDGWQLECLDPLNGESRWVRLVSTEPVDFQVSTLDHSAVYFVSRHAAQARSLLNGRPLWRLRLTDSPVPWRLALAGPNLVLLPAKARLELQRPWLLGGDLPAFPWEVEWRELPVLVLDTATGQPTRQLRLKGLGPRSGVAVVAGGVVLALPGKAMALLAAGR